MNFKKKPHWQPFMCNHIMFKFKIKNFKIWSVEISNILIILWYCYEKSQYSRQFCIMYYLKQYFSAFCKQAIIDKIEFIFKKKAPRGQVSFPWLKKW